MNNVIGSFIGRHYYKNELVNDSSVACRILSRPFLHYSPTTPIIFYHEPSVEYLGNGKSNMTWYNVRQVLFAYHLVIQLCHPYRLR